MKQTITIRVTGRVQGVNYRRSARQQATSLGLTGFVKNLPDGSVWLTASGDATQLALLVEWCRVGPPGAQVLHTAVTELPYHPYAQFSIER